ncbi:hypothetical protein [Candidatus Similichlamydia laticola]|uniref:Uncharacterized protein n=1 Tax=Candidatus Similichlamydia laticola TaxID=2170265 RepID=A0A369KIE7_9BACT|nr:hypothetical protein [Candidatus Similichlamydia laticola]RDB31563.1 hypothetical protein HAT2_00330 [Candidatus Similichlamydia laticola]
MEMIRTKRQSSLEQLSDFFSSWQSSVQETVRQMTLFVLVTENSEEVSFLLRKMRLAGRIKKVDSIKDLLEQVEEMSHLFFASSLKTVAYSLDLKNCSDVEIAFVKEAIRIVEVSSSAQVVVSSPKPFKEQIFGQVRCLDWSNPQPQRVQDRYLGLACFLAKQQGIELDLEQAEALACSCKNNPYALENELIKLSLGWPKEWLPSLYGSESVWDFLRKIEKREWRNALELIHLMDGHPETAVRWMVALRSHLSKLLALQLSGGSPNEPHAWNEKRRQALRFSLRKIGKNNLMAMICSLGAAETAVRLGEASPKEALQAWALSLVEL